MTAGEPYTGQHWCRAAAARNGTDINEWQSMVSIIEMFVTGVAFLFREIYLFSLSITALSLIAKLIVQEIQSILRPIERPFYTSRSYPF